MENTKLKTKRKTRYINIIDLDKCVGCQLCSYECSRRFGDAGIAHTAIWVHSAGDFERGFLISVCQACEDPPCASVCPTDAIVPNDDYGIKIDLDLCIGCKNCLEACVISAIFWDPSLNKPISCVYCGLCVNACPHGVLEFKQKEVYHNGE